MDNTATQTDAHKDTREARFDTTAGVVSKMWPLGISIDDDKLVKYIKHLEDEGKKHYDSDEINLTKRRKLNEKYLFGRQLRGKKLKKWQSSYIDNIIGEAEGMLKSIAVSKMPDIIAKVDPEDEDKQKVGKLLTQAFDDEIKARETKKKLGIMFKHQPTYFIAAMKWRWDVHRNKLGDIAYDVIPPEQVLPDHTATSGNPDEMMYIIHYVTKTGKEWSMLFPNKEADIIEYIRTLAVVEGSPVPDDEILLSQKLTIPEVWFDWFDKAEDFDAEKNPKFNFMSGVAWRLGDKLLGKTRNPNWDYEGHDVATLDGRAISPEEMQQIILSGIEPDNFEIRKVFNNYFDFPKKPFIFMTYEQFMKGVMDETSRIEQTVKLQQSYDDVEQTVDYSIKHNKGKNVFGKQAGLKKKDISKLDMENPNQDLIVGGDPNKTHKFIQPNMPPAEMFIHIRDRRDRIFAKHGTHGAVRGEVTSRVATNTQISREGDFTKADDIVDETILHVATEMARAKLHMMKLRYTPEHWKKLVGNAAEFLEFRLDNDVIDDGVEVEVYASTVDKLKAERNAKELAQLQLIDPLTYYEDVGLPDPKKRTERLLDFNDPSGELSLYRKRHVEGKSIEQIAQEVVPGVPAIPEQGGTVPVNPGQLTTQATVPSPQDTSQVPGGIIGSARNFAGNAVNAIRGMFGGG